jgi:predicted nucleotidyltransferase
MCREEVIAKLRQAEPALRARGVAALYLFGSHARDEASPDSDIDVFVDPVSGERFGFLPFMAAFEAIRDTFGRHVEIGYSTREGLDRYVRADIEREAIRVF